VNLSEEMITIKKNGELSSGTVTIECSEVKHGDRHPQLTLPFSIGQLSRSKFKGVSTSNRKR
jgi:hypothetical protein